MEGKGKSTEKKKRGFRWRSSRDVRRTLNRIASELYTGDLSERKAHAIVYTASTWAKLNEQVELLDRIEALENRGGDQDTATSGTGRIGIAQ